MLNSVAKALWETHQVEVEPTDVIIIEQNYCEPTIVDVVVIDGLTGRKCRFEWFDVSGGYFLH